VKAISNHDPGGDASHVRSPIGFTTNKQSGTTGRLLGLQRVIQRNPTMADDFNLETLRMSRNRDKQNQTNGSY